MLEESEELLEEIATDMDEDGWSCVLGIGEEETTAFTYDGIQYLRDVIPDYKNRD